MQKNLCISITDKNADGVSLADSLENEKRFIFNNFCY